MALLEQATVGGQRRFHRAHLDRITLAFLDDRRVHAAARFGERRTHHLVRLGLGGLQQLGEAPHAVLLDQFEQGGGALFEVHRVGSGIESELGADPLRRIEPARRLAGLGQHHDERAARRQCRFEFAFARRAPPLRP